MKCYVVVYLSPGRIHYRYRCRANNKRAARKLCREVMGISDRDIVEVEEETL